ncbi:UNVERIFIED_CONTAM: Aspartic proteinase-like protein 2 [Sesamum latifolium]|uniref:Aspartic proteinase-like protein 2 n=1 Tax=Sesamum latifolium TaxID=2727402 RepID=A0AAW2TZ31_9LAMI
MAGWVLKVMVAAVAVAAATLVSAVSGGAGIQRVLTLERAFPVWERVELEVVKTRDRARHARMLQSFSGGIVDFPVLGTSDPYVVGLYFTKVRLGSPPREFNVQIDTGSDILWVTCSPCNNCPQSSGLGVPLNFFDVAASSTVSPISCSDNICASIVQTASAECSAESNQCGYSFQYGDGSGTAGFYVSDLLYFDSILGTSLVANSSAPIVFGCSTSLFGDLTKSDRAVDGIFGFGRQDLSVISQLSSRRITPKVFSHCLRGEGNGGGVLVLGEILDPRIVYTPLVPSHVTEIFPSVALNFAGGASMILRPIDYLIHTGFLDGAAMWCMGFIKVQNQGTTILGGSLSVNVSITSSKDEFMNAGQLSVSSSLSTGAVFRLMHKNNIVLMLHLLPN